MFTIALLSRWHPHESRYTSEIIASKDCAVGCVWDEDKARGCEWGRELGVPFESDLGIVLNDSSIDAVCVTTPTSMHKDILIAAARARKHIFVEKSLALHEKDAFEIRDAVIENGVKLGIAYIRRTTGEFIFAKRLVDSGILGDITTLRVRNGHDGTSGGWLPEYWYDPATTGGGAMTDLGCHQMYLADWILGEPESVQSTFAFYANKHVEDSGVCTFMYNDSKTIAIMDSSFASFYTPYTFEIYATEGTALIRLDNDFVEVHLPNMEEQPWFVRDYSPYVTSIKHSKRIVYTIKRDALPDTPSPIRQWIDACTIGTPLEFSIDSAVRLTRMVEGANIAYKEGRTYYFKKG